MVFHRPETLDGAIALLQDAPVRLLAGGTDVYPGLRDGVPTPAMMDLRKIAGLRGIARDGDDWRIGATTTWTDIVRGDLPGLFDGLKAAACEVGSVQIQNAGTIAGNICNASPAADGVPPLLTLNASVEIVGASGTRRVALSDFITGVRRTDLAPGEMVTAVVIPDAPGARSAFWKLGARRYLVISIAMVAVTIVPASDGSVAEARVSVGACSAVAQRLLSLEERLKGWSGSASDLAEILGKHDLSELSPLDDVRGSAEYRVFAAREIIARTLLDAMGDAS